MTGFVVLRSKWLVEKNEPEMTYFCVKLSGKHQLYVKFGIAKKGVGGCPIVGPGALSKWGSFSVIK